MSKTHKKLNYTFHKYISANQNIDIMLQRLKELAKIIIFKTDKLLLISSKFLTHG